MPFDSLRLDQIDHGCKPFFFNPFPSTKFIFPQTELSLINTKTDWGAHTSTIDWCELNYTHSPYIAEFINTLTNLPVIFMSLYGFYATWKGGAYMRYALCFLGLALVGVGSTGFHASLRWEWQLMDELPMVGWFLVSCCWISGYCV